MIKTLKGKWKSPIRLSKLEVEGQLSSLAKELNPLYQFHMFWAQSQQICKWFPVMDLQGHLLKEEAKMLYLKDQGLCQLDTPEMGGQGVHQMRDGV